jgi:hypothetical protein
MPIRSVEWNDLNNLVGDALEVSNINDALRHADRGPLRDLGHDKIRELSLKLSDAIVDLRDKTEETEMRFVKMQLIIDAMIEHQAQEAYAMVVDEAHDWDSLTDTERIHWRDHVREDVMNGHFG